MQYAGFVMNHPSAHWDRVPERFVSDPDLFECMNPARRNRQIDRAPTNKIALAWIGPSLVKIDIVPAAPQVRCEQSACQTTADENKLRSNQGFLTAAYADITDIQTAGNVAFRRGASRNDMTPGYQRRRHNPCGYTRVQPNASRVVSNRCHRSAPRVRNFLYSVC
jgi:hypothetical protein